MARRGDGPDTWTRRAKSEGYAARSIFKLQEIDQRYGLVRGGQRVLDLGCHPGSWLRYLAERVGARGEVVGVDRTETEPPPGPVRTLVGDVLALGAEELDPAGHGFDVVVSDMAPDTTGIRSTDQARSAALAEQALELATTLLRPGGHLVVKVFQGPDVQPLLVRARQGFDHAKLVRPKAVRKESSEVYLVARGRAGAPRSRS